MLFDRSWYNRAGVEHVMGFCTDTEYQEFLRSCPEFEQMLIRSGIILIKYWFSVSDAEQERRFQGRMDDPTRSWKLSPMDIESRAKWVEYSHGQRRHVRPHRYQAVAVARGEGRQQEARPAELHSALAEQIPYQDLTPTPPELPPRPPAVDYVRPPLEGQTFVPEVW